MFSGLKLRLLASEHITTHYGQATQFDSSGHRSCTAFFFVHMNSSLCGVCTWMVEFHTYSWFFVYLWIFEYSVMPLSTYFRQGFHPREHCSFLIHLLMCHPHLSLCVLLIPSSLFPFLSLLATTSSFSGPSPSSLVIHTVICLQMARDPSLCLVTLIRALSPSLSVTHTCTYPASVLQNILKNWHLVRR